MRMSKTRIYLKSLFMETPLVRKLLRARKAQKHSDPKYVYQIIDKYIKYEMTQEERKETAADMDRMFREYGYTYDDYFYYGFAGKSDEERNTYLSEFTRDLIIGNLNKVYNRPLFDDKKRTYEKYKKYYRRELIEVTGSGKDFQKLKDFLQKHKRIIIKPASGSMGRGVHILDIAEMDDVDSILKSELAKAGKYGLVAEEVIVQDERMAAFHPSSLNCLRVTTVRLNDRIELFHSFLKIGGGGSVVDNMNLGGFLCSLDQETGVVLSARDDFAKLHEVHPDTGVPIVGFTVPHWQEAIAFAKELAMVTPSNRWTGWDIALDKDENWVMVEGNARGNFRGTKSEIYGLLKEVGLEKLVS